MNRRAPFPRAAAVRFEPASRRSAPPSPPRLRSPARGRFLLPARETPVADEFAPLRGSVAPREDFIEGTIQGRTGARRGGCEEGPGKGQREGERPSRERGRRSRPAPDTRRAPPPQGPSGAGGEQGIHPAAKPLSGAPAASGGGGRSKGKIDGQKETPARARSRPKSVSSRPV